jgi:hypothetical protein
VIVRFVDIGGIDGQYAFLAYTSSGTLKANILENEAIVQLPSG